MLESFQAHNPSSIPLTLSLPHNDIKDFENEFGTSLPNTTIVADESYCGHELSKFLGWHGQQICKLTSWRAANFEHLAIIDSDCYFVRDVTPAEFLPSETPYIAYGSTICTVMEPGNADLISYLKDEIELTAERLPHSHGRGEKSLADFVHHKNSDLDNPGAIARSGFLLDIFGATRWIFYQPGQIFSRDILKSFQEYLLEYGLTEGDAILICPWEYNWYGEYACRYFHEKTTFKVSSIIHFASEGAIKFMQEQGITQEMITKKFALIQMAARHMPRLKVAD